MVNQTTVSPYVPAPPNQLRDVLAALLGRVDEDSSIDENALREAVCAYVRQLKAEQLPPERVLTTIKAIASQAGVPDSRIEHVDGADQRDRLMRTIVNACIREYYRAD